MVPIRDIEAETNLDFFPEFGTVRQNNLEVGAGVFGEWFGP